MAKTGKRVITSTAMEIKIFLATWSFSLNRDPNDLLNCTIPTFSPFYSYTNKIIFDI